MDLKIKDVAELLRISESTVRRWLTEGKIPAYRLNRQYRFSRTEIEDWVLNRKMGLTDVAEGSAQKKEESPSPGNMQFSLYRAFSRGAVVTGSGGEGKEALIALGTKNLARRFDLDAEMLSELLLERESLMPTALGHGIAVPHTREFLLRTHFDVILVVYPTEPIEYGALDGEKVHTLFFLFACEDRHHLHLLAKLAHLCSSEKAREFLRTKPPKERLLEFIKQWEGTFIR